MQLCLCVHVSYVQLCLMCACKCVGAIVFMCACKCVGAIVFMCACKCM